MINVELIGAQATMQKLQKLANRYPTEAARALNDGFKKGQTAMSKGIRAEVTIKAGSIKRLTSVRRVPSQNDYKAVIRISARKLGAQHYSVRKASRGMRLKVRVGDAPTHYPHAFKYGANWFMRARYENVQGWTGPGGRPPGRSPSGLVHRLPIVWIQGPRLTKVVQKNPEVLDTMADVALKTTILSLETRIRRLIR